MGTLGGYHEYIGGCSLHRGDIMMHVGDTMSKEKHYGNAFENKVTSSQ